MVVAAVFTPPTPLLALFRLDCPDSWIFATLESTFSDPGCLAFSFGGTGWTDVRVDERFIGFLEGDTGAMEPIIADFAVYHPGSLIGFAADAVYLFAGAGGARVGRCRGFGGCDTGLSG